MATFTSKGGKLFIDGAEVLAGWESFTGWYWFGTERAYKQDSLMPDGSVAEGDQIWFGRVQGLEEERGYFSEAELKSMGSMVWPIPKSNLPWSGRRR